MRDLHPDPRLADEIDYEWHVTTVSPRPAPQTPDEAAAQQARRMALDEATR